MIDSGADGLVGANAAWTGANAGFVLASAAFVVVSAAFMGSLGRIVSAMFFAGSRRLLGGRLIFCGTCRPTKQGQPVLRPICFLWVVLPGVFFC
jgi:NAD/NADP transhydrogenase beta subunit